MKLKGVWNAVKIFVLGIIGGVIGWWAIGRGRSIDKRINRDIERIRTNTKRTIAATKRASDRINKIAEEHKKAATEAGEIGVGISRAIANNDRNRELSDRLEQNNNRLRNYIEKLRVLDER